MRRSSIIRALCRLRRRDDGAALVEFGMILPMILIVFAVAIESARTFWAYQATIAGVRDASRYIGRSVQNDICQNGGSLASVQATAEAIVRDTIDGNSLFVSSMQVVWVRADLTCIDGDFRLGTTPIAEVSAKLSISYPMQTVFEFVGLEIWPVDTVVRDQSRIFGS